MPVLWVLWGIGVLNVVAVFLTLAVYLIRSRFMEVGPPFLFVLSTMLAIVTTFAGGLSGLLLVLLTDAGVVLIAGTVVLLAGAAFATAFALNQVRLSRQVSRIGKHLLRRRDKVLDLIRAGRVRSGGSPRKTAVLGRRPL
ncbi:hypothetical protein [Amycolatopsis sp. MtRt-6]|uniref:hypothetical protein n=1 Tax=Amycolatopsis sp. MtRt-6 TaxID=2792782 RepID=UPI001A904A58|nr:hypothetical protein [Amycolatopsis sp. MtRt-6]